MSMLSKLLHAIFDDKTLSEKEMAEKLDALEAAGSERLAWRTSVVDLLKLLKLPSDQTARMGLAEDLGVDNYRGLAADNDKLHKEVMHEVSKRYIPIPK